MKNFYSPIHFIAWLGIFCLGTPSLAYSQTAPTTDTGSPIAADGPSGVAVPRTPPPPPLPSEGLTTVRGRVIDGATGVGVAGAYVSVTAATSAGFNAATLADDDGGFILEEVPVGTIEFVAVADFFEPSAVQLQVTTQMSTTDVVIEIALVASDTLITGEGEVVIITGEAPNVAAPPSYDLAAADIQVLPGSGNDVLKSLQSMPGVARVPFGLGGLVLRGASPRDTNVYLDGIEVPLLYHFGGLASFYPSAMLSSLEMIPGAFGAEHGRAQGGVVLLRSRPGRSDRWRIESEVSLIDASVRGDGPGPAGGSWSLGLRRSYVDAVLAFAVPEDSSLSLTLAPRYYDGQLRYDLPLGNGRRLSAMVFGSDDRLSFIASDDDEMEENTFRYVSRFVRAALRLEERRGDFVLSLTPWMGWDESLLRVDDQGLANETIPVGARFDLTRNFSRGAIRAGIDMQGGRLTTDNYSEPPPMPGTMAGTTPGIEDDDDEILVRSQRDTWYSDTAIWAEALFRFADGIASVKPGMRAERYGLSSEWVFDPRLSLEQRAGERVTLRQAVGLYHQPPNAPDLDPAFGNPDLASSYAVQTSAGIDVDVTPQLEVSATGFYDRVYDMPVDVVTSATSAAEPGSALSGGAGATSREFTVEQFGSYSYQENVGRGRNYGIETLLKAGGGQPNRAGSWLGWISYTYSRAQRRGDPAQSMEYYPYVLDQPHVLTALGSIQLTEGWRFGARVRYVSGNPITPVEDAYFDADTQEYRPTSGEILSQRLPAFFQLDLRVDRRWQRSWGTLSLFLDVQNVTNRVNPEGVSYNFDYSQRDYTRGLPIFPSIGLEYRQ